VKFELGLFENPMPNPALKSKVGLAESRQASLQAARESMTLLKNTNNLLPLSKDRKVLVTGPTADSLISLNNGWTYVWQWLRTIALPERPSYYSRCDRGEGRRASITYLPGTKIQRGCGRSVKQHTYRHRRRG